MTNVVALIAVLAAATWSEQGQTHMQEFPPPSRPPRTAMTSKLEESVFVIDIPGQTANAKSVIYQAAPENTLSGIRWTLSGDLAKAIAAYATSLQEKEQK